MNKKIVKTMLGLSLIALNIAPANAQKNVIKGAKQAVKATRNVKQVDSALIEQLVKAGMLKRLQDPFINMHSNSLATGDISRGIEQLQTKLNFNHKFWNQDPSLWSKEPETQAFISQFLGWQNVYDWTLSHLVDIKTFALDAKENFDYCVVMGMGGSSLAPEVFRQVFGKQDGWPELLVLDTTNPGQIAQATKHIDIKRTLFIYASKSGGTVEPASQYAYFKGLLQEQGVTNPGQNFVAITDKGTGLEELAIKDNFRKIFLNPADVGGRFSALSMFGIVPAAVMGVDVERLLTNAANQAGLFGPAIPEHKNVALQLGALMGEHNHGKMVLLTPNNLKVLGLWIEQLVAESLGKEAQGVVPVAGSNMHPSLQPSHDQFFVRIDTHTPADGTAAKMEKMLSSDKSQYPVFTMDMTSPYQIGSMMLAWEIATAAAGAQLGINPFDQPNVQAAKKMTQNLLAQLKAGQIPAGIDTPVLVSKALEGTINPANITAEDFYQQINPGDYVAILPYLTPTDEIDKALVGLREAITKHTGQAVTLGYGPRYLHSTGQMHKGASSNGVFIILSAEPAEDVKIPGQDYTFGQLTNSQALGDFQALEQNDRRAIRIYWDKSTSVVKAIKELTNKLK